MKQNVSPAAVTVAIIVVAAIIVFFAYRTFASPAGSAAGQKAPGPPADVQAEFQKRLGGMSGPRLNSGPQAPSMPSGLPPGAVGPGH